MQVTWLWIYAMWHDVTAGPQIEAACFSSVDSCCFGRMHLICCRSLLVIKIYHRRRRRRYHCGAFSLSFCLFFLSVSISIASNGFVLFFIRHIRAGNEYAIYVIAMNGQALLNWNPKRRRAWTITTFDESMAEQKRARFTLELHFSILI